LFTASRSNGGHYRTVHIRLAAIEIGHLSDADLLVVLGGQPQAHESRPQRHSRLLFSILLVVDRVGH
jgi:hypothetical protein